VTTLGCGLINRSPSVIESEAPHEAERRDLRHVAMLACKFGCDALFEDGYLAVDQDGTVVVAAGTNGLSQAVVERLDALHGQVCGAFTAGSAPYFDWHRHNVFLG
jgi:hypothetical protein